MELHKTKVYLLAILFLLCGIFLMHKSVYGYYACGGSCSLNVNGCAPGVTCRPSSKICGTYYNICDGISNLTCDGTDATGGWDQTTCNTANQCNNAGTTRTAGSWSAFGSCSVACGVGTKTRTCNCGSENNCATSCTSPASACAGTDSPSCCVDQAPNEKPVVTSVGPSCSTNGSTTINWTFTGAGGCGASWGYACSSANNIFRIRDNGVLVTGYESLSPGLRTITIPGLAAGSHSFQVCANNGFTGNCSDAVPITTQIDASAPPIPGGRTVTFTPDAICPDKYIAKYSWNAVTDNAGDCAGLHTSPYWDQISSDIAPVSPFTTTVSTVLNNSWSNPNPIADQALTPYPPNTTLSFHVRSRDALNNQSEWSPTYSAIVPTPVPYSVMHISGNFSEDVNNTCTSLTVGDISALNITLTAQVNPGSLITSPCTFDSSSYSCSITFDNTKGGCVATSADFTLTASYLGYSSVTWHSGDCATGPITSTNMVVGGPDKNLPLYFQFAGDSWFKLKSASFNSRMSVSGRQNFIPNSISLFKLGDTDDSTAKNYMIIGTAGTVVQDSPVSIVSGTKYSENNWYTSGYHHTNDIPYLKYIDYITARKDFKPISGSPSVGSFPTNGIYSISEDVALNQSWFDGKTIVLVVQGGKTATFNADFIPPNNGSVAVLANTIEIKSSVAEINAILIGQTVTTKLLIGDDAPSAVGLKIKGNLIDESSTFDLTRAQANARQPSLFVVFDPALYLNVLPYLSTSTYDWRQIQ